MLELIVLGEIPGTHIVITFSGVLAVMAMLFGASIARAIKKYSRLDQRVRIDDITL